MIRIRTPFARLFAPLFAITLALAAASPAAAYSRYGHETSAEIAYRNAKPQTRAAIDQLLRQSRLLDTPTCPAGTIEDASVWADCVRGLGPRFSYTSSWHYQNVNVCQAFDLKAPCKDGNCVSAQVDRDVKLLKDKTVPLRERVQALVFLIHFVGDMHQPLHAGDRADLGGNQVSAAYGIVAPGRLNLHSVWDGYLAERAITTPPTLMRTYSDTEKAEIQAGGTEEWSRQAWQASRDSTYTSALGGDPCGPVPKRAVLNDATIADLVPVAKLQVERGGLRLAMLLDEALS